MEKNGDIRNFVTVKKIRAFPVFSPETTSGREAVIDII
ncbi:hypothetical protein B4135_0039 [Caldibacillus debilis]|uniref:Uncharacterized protein n=1 Tax=Caldibacillus debilis TaxID=301148 RepID=A0A150M3J3_9BACI|nr:hypothetical protein B4135_0039 [Caldibacillus debilis]